MAQMSLKSKEKEELNIIIKKDKEVTKQVWVIIAIQKVIKNLKSCQPEIIICAKNKNMEEAI